MSFKLYLSISTDKAFDKKKENIKISRRYLEEELWNSKISSILLLHMISQKKVMSIIK